jgi:hypothetical protein
MKLDTYIKRLETLSNEVPALVNGFVKREKGVLLSSVKLRLWNYGKDGDGNLIGGGRYAQSTIERKKNSPYSRTSHVTLRDTGKWYGNLYVVYHNGTLLLENKDRSLTSKLVDGDGKRFRGYGSAIMDFTQDEIDYIVNSIIDNLTNYLQKEFNTDIDIEL